LAYDLWLHTMTLLKPEYFLAIVFFLLLVERIFSYLIYFSSRREVVALRDELAMMRSEFVKLSALLQAFLMNVKFKDSGQVESNFKSTDTQVMVSAIELKRLRDAEQLLREESVDRLLHRRRKENDTTENDELGEIIS
jgi:biopolymer transport protein ExbB/TolQ